MKAGAGQKLVFGTKPLSALRRVLLCAGQQFRSLTDEEGLLPVQ